MCGVCGVFDYAGAAAPVEPAVIASMRDAMAHRGPDDTGQWSSEDRRVGLGFRRLSIVDLSAAGNQPMTNEDGSVRIVYNGETYNHLTLRKELEERGHRYRSRTDTETVVHAYEEWGIEAINRLEGMFGFALWDARQRKMYLVRDRIGVKPMYYTFVNGRLIFGSEIKAILRHPDVRVELDPTAAYHYLTFLVTPAPFTMFKNIYKLPAGHWMSVEDGGKITIHQYWDAVVPALSKRPDEGEVVERVRELVTDAVEKRMMADVPVGVFLSGGVDSSLNVALMARAGGKNLASFTVGFEGYEEDNEFQYARQIAREFETNHHEVMVNHEGLTDFATSLVFYQDEPIGDWVCIPLYYVAKLARENGVPVVQVGEGSDEQFSGYEHYLTTLRNYRRVWQPVGALPGVLKALIANSTPLAYRAARRISWRAVRGVNLIERAARATPDEEMFWGGAISLREDDKAGLWSQSALERVNGARGQAHPAFGGDSALGYSLLNGSGEITSHDVPGTLLQHLDRRKGGTDYLERMVYLELKQRLPELLLMRVDKMTMANSLEARVPFVDHRLVEYTMSLPMSLKIKGGMPKYILKKAAEGIIPRNIIYRRKVGFGAPVGDWFRDYLSSYAAEGILDSKLRRESLFDYDAVKGMLDAHSSGETDHGLPLWLLFNLSRWYDYWVDGSLSR